MYWPIRWQILGFWGAKVTKMEDFLPWTPMNRSADSTPLALSLAEKSVTVQTNKQTKLKTNKQ